MQIPVFAWPNADIELRFADRIATLRNFVRRIDVEAVLGCTGWALLLVTIVRSSA